MMGFSNYLVTKAGSLVRTFIRSPDFAAGSAGWQIARDGSAEFNNVVIRGGTAIGGTDLYYSGTPAAGNLISSVSGAPGTDSFGNAYLAGNVSYFGGVKALRWAGSTSFIDYQAASYAGPWIASGTSLVIDSPRITLDAPLIQLDGGPVTATGGSAASPTLITTDTWHMITLDATWTLNGAYAAPAYRLLPDGNLHLTGLADWGSSQTVNRALNSANPLPAAYRPVSQKVYRSTGGATGRGGVQIAATGVITMLASAAFPGQFCEIDGILPLGL